MKRRRCPSLHTEGIKAVGKNAKPDAAPLKIAHIDAVTGPTDWAGRSIELERKMGMVGHAPAPPKDGRRPGDAHVDAVTQATSAAWGATSWGFPDDRPDGADATTGATVDATTGATRRSHKHSPTPTRDEVDAATGATPGVAAACRDLGMSALGDVVNELGIKPPGQA